MKDMNRLLRLALILSIITIAYNFAEGIISVFFGSKDETLTLLGFGVDSFVEVISGLGILHMILRMRFSKVVTQDKFEKTALNITGFSFYLLTLGLIVGAIVNIAAGAKPHTTIPGLIISAISILTMYWLMKSKLNVGKQLNSDAIIADAHCTKTCFYLSFILLGASLIYELAGIGFIDALGSIGIAFYSFKEGKESIEKAKTGIFACCDNDECRAEIHFAEESKENSRFDSQNY
jgi:divalent metal cation (Fe/Co/Zn/Cd) transporter